MLTNWSYNVNMTSAILYEQEKPPSEFVPLDHVPDALVCPEKWGCPKNNGCKKHKNETSAFVLRCGWDFPGGDYVHFHAKDLHSCGQACVEDDRCLAATFTGNIKSGLCYLKDNIYPVNKLALVDSMSFTCIDFGDQAELTLTSILSRKSSAISPGKCFEDGSSADAGPKPRQPRANTAAA